MGVSGGEETRGEAEAEEEEEEEEGLFNTNAPEVAIRASTGIVCRQSYCNHIEIILQSYSINRLAVPSTS